MFVGRGAELKSLERSYQQDKFQMIVLYGRRRVGKTTLLAHFAQDKPTLFYTAQEQSDKDNLSDFSSQVAAFFNLPQGVSFDDWLDAFKFCADQASKSKFLLVFDEFPYAALANTSLPSKLQIAIDHYFLNTNMCMVLCGSNQGFMESDVLGKKSPLHGRKTSQIKLSSFDYIDAAKMLGGVSFDDAFKYYACIGGTPYYLSQVDTSLSFDKNIEQLFFSPDGFLFTEPTMLLRQEMREPALYNSILRAIASGANKQKEIADRIGVQTSALGRYLANLRDIELIERIVPFGENVETSRKGLYRIKDASYDFWYTFVASAVADIEGGVGALSAKAAQGERLSEYLGHRFERVCMEFLKKRALAGALPIAATSVGSWWGTDKSTKIQTDIDVLAADKQNHQLLIGECKYRNAINETEEIKKLFSKRSLIKGYTADSYMFFSKNKVSDSTKAKYKTQGINFVAVNDLYEI